MTKTHGMTKTRLHRIWWGMICRCDYPSMSGYSRYGGRGITYDPRWRDFEYFRDEMGSGYNDEMSIDRIDPDGNYCKENCRWIPLKDQAGTRKKCVYIEFNGERLAAGHWAKRIGIHPDTIRYRLKNGWNIKDILSVKPNHGNGHYYYQ